MDIEVRHMTRHSSKSNKLKMLIKFVNILQELAESEPEAYFKHQEVERGTTSWSNQSHRAYRKFWMNKSLVNR